MAFTYGFYNSLNGDRKYNAFQMSQMFDGIILDGVFEAIGQHFAVTAGGGMTVNVGTGRAWFNHTWNDNDNIMPITLPVSDLNRSRYDAVVIEVGDPNVDRTNTIKVVSGAVAVNPTKPTLNRGATNNDAQNPNSIAEPPYQHALAYILVKPGAEEITAADIEIVVGKDETPFVTGPIETRSIEELFNQWDAQFQTWFNNLQAQLTDNVVTNLQHQIDQNREAIEYLEETFQVVEKVHVDIFTSGGVFTNPTDKDLTINALLFGGGGGGYTSANGGGGGYMSKGNVTLSPNERVNITIGTGGAVSNNGGTTSFGTYLSANGGYAGSSTSGGNGGSGGGGGGGGSYGGGGGNNSNRNGGSGGTYGGGGGGGGGGMYEIKSGSYGIVSPSSGGSRGTYGGNGGSGGDARRNGITASNGDSGSSGTNTNSMDVEFKGYGTGGSGGSGGSSSSANPWSYTSGGGGGGGGGYGGSGGRGGGGTTNNGLISSTYVYGGGGGGGGGYGANGGQGGVAYWSNAYGWTMGGGGGGGGYGGKGGDAGGYQGTGYGAGGGAGWSSLVSSSDHQNAQYAAGGGGGGYGTSAGGMCSQKGTPGISGVCIITYTVREIQIN